MILFERNMLRASHLPFFVPFSLSHHSTHDQTSSYTPFFYPSKFLSRRFGREANNTSSAKLSSQWNNQRVQFVHGKLLSELSTWRIGGPAKYFTEFSNQTQLVAAIRYCVDHSIRFFIVGKGSNCLFDDRGFDGCVMLNRIQFLERIHGGIYRVGSGYPLNKLGMQCSAEGFAGFEFACGIPGTIGGAVFMNAGAHGQEISDVIESVEIITINGEHRLIGRNDLLFYYRQSSFQKMQDLAAIVAVTFHLTPSSTSKTKAEEYLSRRKSSQPLSERSAGSVFRNPMGSAMTAGELIDKAGLKGYSIGGAKVSDMHANFFINLENSTSRDMVLLIKFVQEQVKLKFGIELEEEVCMVPYG
ncbi:uncharacterized protein LOC116264057 isoform X2 [Nymphaea colorata]|uniref:uncharacterized protein LOC116264057 isoform X2 n=1 Tax=Nymphaea colorata TaxID=210225 RepID=UPI00129DD402|nr:uncharacterized protein LOC116264057 isoform X2 [Nymphaea colorata]